MNVPATVLRKSAMNSPIVTKDRTTSRDVMWSRDYNKFTLAEENRKIVPSHVAKLCISMREYGFLPEMPVHVVIDEDGQFIITDGQHRFTAAESLGLEVGYLVKESTSVTRDIMVINTFSRAWKDNDYLHHFVAQEYPSYEHLQGFIAEHKIPLFIGMRLLNDEGRKDKLIMGEFREGKFTSSDRTRLAAAETMRRINEIRFVHERITKLAHDRAFMYGLLNLLRHPHYVHSRFTKNVAANIRGVVKCSNVTTYMEMFEEIYNFRLQAANRVRFTEKK